MQNCHIDCLFDLESDDMFEAFLKVIEFRCKPNLPCALLLCIESIFNVHLKSAYMFQMVWANIQICYSALWNKHLQLA